METTTNVHIKVTTHESGKKTYVGEIRHEGLGKHRLIRDTSENEEFIRLLLVLQTANWEHRFELVERKKLELEERAPGLFKAEVLTRDIQSELKRLETILAPSTDVSNGVDWIGLKAKFRQFSERVPTLSSLPAAPVSPSFPIRPSKDTWDFQPSFTLLDKLVASRKLKRIEEAQLRYQDAVFKWQRDFDQTTDAQTQAFSAYTASVVQMKLDHQLLLGDWDARKTAFSNQENLRNAAIDAKQAAYLALEPSAIVDYCDLVLAQSVYPNFFPQEFELDYDPSSRQLIVDYLLPAPDDIPRLKGIKWVATRSVFEEQKLTEAVRTKLYDDVVYQIVLRTAHELFNADVVGAIKAVVINGIVNSIDRGTGKEVTACILSLRVEATEFQEINLEQVDPKACFKTLKGVGSSKLHGLSPIPPIMTILKNDSRFVAAYGVADSLDEGDNLASMGWEDFEHLIRELFEKEFSSTGGEVRVTQASRDGGVDAIAFDPDPIRGGKIVIQAKRYTNTVGVSAVRDLYGTVMNEGATKGVLVTTSDYGPDSYNFAQGKPLVLLNGGNLLHMLEKHGHKAKINIREAKKFLAAQSVVVKSDGGDGF